MNEERQAAMEAWVIDFLDERRKKQKMTVEEWADKVYPGVKSGRMRLQHLRKPQGASGKRKRLLFAEFVLMSKALNIPPAEVVTLATNAFEETSI